MIPSVVNPVMSPQEVERFRVEMKRRMRQEFSPQEIIKIETVNRRRQSVYQQVIRNNGGKNPILGF